MERLDFCSFVVTLRRYIYADEKKLIQARHRLEAVQARNRQKERKARTRRLIQEGAILESVWPEIRDIPMADLPRKLHDKLSNAP